MNDTTTTIEREYISPRETAERYGGSAALWRLHARNQALPAYRLGGTLIVFKVEDVERFILSSPVTGPAPHRNGKRRGRRPGRRPGQRKSAASA